ncbi:phasin family protein [Micromonospora sp. NPDC051925]|uniref:phasin family protein n=1 Tax=Micromonospora sp. NPDC051925 TaxID=3364288 RepID=UPI0037C8E60C
MQDAWRAYLELALGLTEAPRKRAQDAARRLAGTGGATAVQLQALAEELVATGAANREALTKLVRFEVDRALGAVGLATADEVAELTRRVHELERQLRAAKGGPAAPLAGDAVPDTTVTVTRTVAKKAVKKVVKKAAATPSAEPGSPGEDPPPRPRPVKKTTAVRRRAGGAE